MSNTLDVLIHDVNASLPERKLVELVERTRLSADMKAILCDLARITVRVGSRVLAVGRKILAFVFDLIKVFPTVTLGVLCALVLTSLIAAIPLMGGTLAAMLGGILMVMGVSAGAINDFLSDKLKERIDALVDSFGALVDV